MAKAKAAKPLETTQTATVRAPNFGIVKIPIISTAPMVQNQFPEKAKQMMMNKMAGVTKKSEGKSKREARNYEQEYKDSMHRSTEGWIGFPATGFKAACVRAGSLTDIEMTRLKLILFFIPDGYSADGTPLTKIEGEHQMLINHVRVQMSTDIRSRAMIPNWKATLQVKFDADQISLESVCNLVLRAGNQVGVGEGRNFSKTSVGMGWGSYTIDESRKIEATGGN